MSEVLNWRNVLGLTGLYWALTASGCILATAGGCKSYTPEQVASVKDQLGLVSTFAKENNVTVIGRIRVSEPGGELYQGAKARGMEGEFYVFAHPEPLPGPPTPK